MKKQKKLFIALGVTSTLTITGIIVFPVCGAPTYEWTNPATNKTRQYGIGWLNYENTSSYLAKYEPHFTYFLDSLTSANIAFAHEQISIAQHWLAVSTDPNDIRKYKEDVIFLQCYINTIPMFVMSLIGLVVMSTSIPIFCFIIYKLVKLNKKSKEKIIDPLF